MTQETKEFSEKPLDKMTVSELREVAKDIPSIVGASGMKKPELLSAIKEAKGIVDEAPKKSGPPKEKVKVPVAQLKGMIKDLKGKRRQSLQDQNRKMATRFRRQISRLKKKTRNAA